MSVTYIVAKQNITQDQCFAKSGTNHSPTHIAWEDANTT